jgi:site-specific DNA recombinase
MTDNNSRGENLQAKDSKRCAIYARYSSDLQRPSSIEDQIRKCRQECQRYEGWTIVEEWVVSDQEVSGRSLAGRDAMDFLKRAAKAKPRPFDCVLIDDTSRFGRNLGDVLKLAEVFKHYGVSLHFVSPRLDSSDPNFHQLLVFKGMMDEQYSVDLGHKVRRGQEGRVLAGYNAGGPCYGYRNVPEMDADGKLEIGVRLEIIPAQAEVVLQIFEMYAKGFSLDAIARKLRAAGVPAPRPPRKNSVRGWSADGIAGILRNKKYISINERGRTTDASMQQYGFSTITVSGLTLDTSRVRRKPKGPEQEQENGESIPISLTPAESVNDPTKASDSAPREIHA